MSGDFGAKMIVSATMSNGAVHSEVIEIVIDRVPSEGGLPNAADLGAPISGLRRARSGVIPTFGRSDIGRIREADDGDADGVMDVDPVSARSLDPEVLRRAAPLADRSARGCAPHRGHPVLESRVAHA